MHNHTFSESQWRTLQALVDCLIPEDDDWPSGWQAGVGDYLAQQFERDLRDQVEWYGSGLDALEAEAQASTGAPFVELNIDAQTQLLTQLEHRQTQTAWPIDPHSFLNTAMQHAAEGFYSDPGNGGNKHSVAWRMVGYEVKG
jgi:gluconate 2-dehydrogenase gamma chain